MINPKQKEQFPGSRTDTKEPKNLQWVKRVERGTIAAGVFVLGDWATDAYFLHQDLNGHRLSLMGDHFLIASAGLGLIAGIGAILLYEFAESRKSKLN